MARLQDAEVDSNLTRNAQRDAGLRSARKTVVRPERLLGCASSLRDRRRCRSGVQLRRTANLSNSTASVGREFDLARNAQRDAGLRSARKTVVRPERFELPASWFVARRSIQLSYGRNRQIVSRNLRTYRRIASIPLGGANSGASTCRSAQCAPPGQNLAPAASGARILPYRISITIPPWDP